MRYAARDIHQRRQVTFEVFICNGILSEVIERVKEIFNAYMADLGIDFKAV
ncbi:hypothetical protein D3C73_1418520 [compost metagenome]